MSRSDASESNVSLIGFQSHLLVKPSGAGVRKCWKGWFNATAAVALMTTLGVRATAIMISTCTANESLIIGRNYFYYPRHFRVLYFPRQFNF